MAEEAVKEMETDTDTGIARIYEIGYTIMPTVKGEDLETIVGGIRSEIGKAGGDFIAEGSPSIIRLAYPMSAEEGDKHLEHDRAYFGWIKFEADVAAVRMLEEMLKKNASIMRFIVFRTVREDTRAKMKAPTLREVKRTDTIQVRPRRAEEQAGPVSEEKLERAIQDITAE
ncbi:30S ribosomal protein S6 [Candidatus Kaiserbacteria bacterium]|nr:30S ribosomal protein S6 [Candidatus Kaiserbacteria bacterium]